MEKPKHIDSPAQFEKLLSTYKIVVTDFYADWCGPCKAIAPVFESLCAAESKPGRVVFCKVDVDSQREIAGKYNVTAMPTFIIFQSGNQKHTIRGANPGALRTAVKTAVASAGAGGSASFSSAGQVLGSGSKVGGSSGGVGLSFASLPEGIVPGGLLGTIVRFVGLYFTTLFTLDPLESAESSPFKMSADPSRRR